MIKLMKYLKKSAGYVILIIGLLFLQAYCDLSLPDYTSKIINVGIQQGGIPDGVPEKLRQSTMDNLKLFMDEDTQKKILDAYVLDRDVYELKDDVTGDDGENADTRRYRSDAGSGSYARGGKAADDGSCRREAF